MTPERQQQVIAEAVGRKGQALYPDYLFDLNAMREAIMSQPLEVQERIQAELWRISPMPEVIFSAAKYSEAFLRALGKWEE